MKTMKFAIVFIFILICMVFIGESYQDLLGSFTSSYAYISVEKPQNQSESTMLSEIISKAKKNKVSFFAEKAERRGLSDSAITIYYSDVEILKDLKNRFQITEKTYPSLFVGNTRIVFTPFSEIKNIDDIKNLRLTGTNSAVENFQKEIYHYAGKEPKMGIATSAPKDSLILVWFIAGLAILFVTIYELLLTKKETQIKISFGERPMRLILKNILYDMSVFSLLFGVAFIAASQITYCGYLIQKTLLCFVIILVLNAGIYFSILHSDMKIAFSSVHRSNKLLFLNYGVKIVTMVLTVCIISSNIALIAEGWSYLKQKPFYNQFENHSFLTALEKTQTENGLSAQRLNYEFYKKCAKNNKVVAQSYLGGESETIYINKINQNYLKEKIKSLETESFLENKLYFIVPEDMPEKDAKLAEAKDFVEFFFRTKTLTEDKFEVITYSENTSMLAVKNDSENLNSFYMKNPIVFYENVEGNALDEFYGKADKDFVRYGLENNLMFEATKEEFLHFAQSQGYDTNAFYFNSGNVLASFMEQANKINHIVYINFILCLVILLIEFMIISLIIKMEYTVNAVELTIKRVFGYHLLERNKNIILLTMLTSIFALISALTINFLNDLTQPLNILLGGVLIWMLEFPVILYNLCKLEKAGIQKLLKGGSL